MSEREEFLNLSGLRLQDCYGENEPDYKLEKGVLANKDNRMFPSDYTTLVQIKCFQRKKRFFGKIIPHRYRIANAWCKSRDGVFLIQEVGHDYWWPFPDGFCPNYLGREQAIILQETINPKVIDRDRSMEVGTFEDLDFSLSDDADDMCF